MSTTTTPTTPKAQKKYSNYQELLDDSEALKEQEYIYDPKFELNSKPKEGNNKNIITSFIAQLRPGMDVSRIQAPIFTMRPKSYLEMTADFVTPHSFMINLAAEPQPEKRIALLSKWILINVSIVPQKGFTRMKPYNPILGEQFLCKWEHEDSTTELLAEQVCHHPPITSLYLENKKHGWVYTSTAAPKSTFWGNKFDMSIEGEHTFHLLKLGEKYVVNWPSIVGRGVILGSALVELSDSVHITCEKTGYELKVDIKKKGGDVDGFVKNKEGDIVIKISGNIEGKIVYSEPKTKAAIDSVDVKSVTRPTKIVKPVAQQKTNESRRVWHHVSYSIYSDELDTAAKYKHFVEEEQRKFAKARKEKGEKYSPLEFKELPKKIRNDAPLFEYKNLNLNVTSASKQEVEEALLDLE